jgi:glycosyltransferase involved in cell wall biosynthesis/ubiquinone/menaquinone biosynthesis C-methylase UbiE
MTAPVLQDRPTPPAALPASDLVSVVIPTYNYAHFLIATLESVLAQTYGHYEIIIVDDGSTDDTRQRLKPYWDRIRYVYQENQGLSAARNTGIREARGELIALLDSDDLWHPRKLEMEARYLAEHPEVALVASDDVARGYTDSPRQGWSERPPQEWPAIDDDALAEARTVTLDHLVLRSHFGACGVLVRKACFAAVGLFDTSLRSCEDRDMWIRIASRYRVARLALPLWWYRLHAGSMQKCSARMEEYEYQVLGKAFSQLPPLRRRFFLRQKAYSRAGYSAALLYTHDGQQFLALRRILYSFLRWPLPYRRDEVKTALARPKTIIISVLRLLGLKRIAEKQDSPALRRHYQVERMLADKLRNASREERQRLYSEVYDDLFRLVPDHPQRRRKADPRVQAQRVRRQLMYLQPFLRTDAVYLEIGAGDCSLALAVAERVRHAYAVDVSELITRTDRRPDNFTLMISNGTDLDVPAGTVDVAYSYMLLEHLHPEDAAEHLRQVFRALAPGGVYVCVTQHRYSGPHDVSRFFDKEATGFHLKEYTFAELRELLRQAGFGRTQVCMSLKGRIFKVPSALAWLAEKALGLLPRRLRRRLASTLPLRTTFVDATFVGRKSG